MSKLESPSTDREIGEESIYSEIVDAKCGHNKPKLDIEQQIEHMMEKGIKFDIVPKEDAHIYLSQNNNYFKLRAYRQNYFKHPGGKSEGKYINLDFAYLKDLATIDMKLRYLLLHMALDVEHYAKVKILNLITSSREDCYSIVADYVAGLSSNQNESYKREISNSSRSPYCGNIVTKYKDVGFPVWAFVEIISFGRFISFYGFCAKRLKNEDLLDDYHLMLAVKDLRNAAAHNNCLLNDLRPGTSTKQTNNRLQNELGSVEKSKMTRKRKMSNIRVQQIATLLYTHKKLVISPGIQKHQSERLHAIISKCFFRNIDYYENNPTIKTTFEFLRKVIDNWFPLEYNPDT